MTISLKSLRGRPLAARDGTIGAILDVYLDDRDWSVRHFVFDTGKPMPQRLVLVPAAAVTRQLRTHLSRAELERCHEVEEDPPLYLQHDVAAHPYRGDPHLRSMDVLAGYAVVAIDGAAGQLKDLRADPDGCRRARALTRKKHRGCAERGGRNERGAVHGEPELDVAALRTGIEAAVRAVVARHRVIQVVSPAGW